SGPGRPSSWSWSKSQIEIEHGVSRIVRRGDADQVEVGGNPRAKAREADRNTEHGGTCECGTPRPCRRKREGGQRGRPPGKRALLRRKRAGFEPSRDPLGS